MNPLLVEMNEFSEVIYAIIPDLEYDNPLDVIIFASENKILANNMLNYLTSLNDNTMLQHIIDIALDCAQEVVQTKREIHFKFSIIEVDKKKLENHYYNYRFKFGIGRLLYNFLAIEGMLNLKFGKYLSSRANDRVSYNPNTLNKIRRHFNDPHIV